MFKKILIANRGEIACRVMQACRELDIATVAIFSEPDRDSKHVGRADEAWKLEGSPTQVYLDAAQIVDIACRAGADAIHPGYGFLSENASFASACRDAGLVFIGPEPDVIEKMGSKVESRRMMSAAGVPVVPGTTDPVSTTDEVLKLAEEFGYPVAIKASAGGGGRGLRVVRRAEEVEAALSGAMREGSTYFGSAEVYVEKYLDLPRHIEVQILADKQDKVLHLFERDCSTQRRHQKLIEESPAANLSADLRAELLLAAVRGARALSYSSAGTMEFLVAGDKFYFLEMNTRVQVEHPVTEMITGVDIVKEQIRIAAGLPLAFDQEDIVQRGHAIEFRINAENPDKHFMPNPGTLAEYSEPQLPWVRVDSSCYRGGKVLPLYDSLLAKLIVWGATRDEAIKRSRIALSDYRIEGLATTIPFHIAMLEHDKFLEGKVFTSYVESSFLKEWQASKNAATVVKSDAGKTEGKGAECETLERSAKHSYEVEVNQKLYRVAVTELKSAGDSTSSGAVGQNDSSSGPAGNTSKRRRKISSLASSSGEVRASMHGLVKQILVDEGAKVQSGQKLLIFEAMKMESDIVAGKDGTISSIKVKAGQTVDNDSLLLTIE